DGQLPIDREPTWVEVAAAANRRYGIDSTDLDYLHVADDGRAYTVSTYNPKSKWDWWQIGGRWTGYFVPVEGAHGDPRLLLGQPGVFGNRPTPGRVDGGPRGLLDLDALRNAKAMEAGAQYDDWQALTSDLPAAKGWSHF
uniref:hypothetical protein n=1 Tax=Streptomyces sp. NRRL F-6674 TaxID=1463877 RepID=UPI00052720DB